MGEKNTNPVTLIQAGNIDEITALLGDLSDNELIALAVIEAQAEQPRKGVKDAIEAEQQTRADANPTTDFEALAAGLQSELNDVTAERDDLQGKLAALQNKHVPPKAAKLAKAKPVKFTEKGDFDNARGVIFIDADNKAIPSLPELTFRPDDFHAINGGRLLLQKIELPSDGPRVGVAGVVLIDAQGNAVGGNFIRVPLSVGAGQTATLRARSVMFRKPEADAKAA